MVLLYLFKALSRLLAGHGLGGSTLLAGAYLKIAKILLPEIITFRGIKIYLSSPDAMSLAVFGKYNEDYELSLFESMIDNRSVVLDIGANIGLYTLTAAKHADKVYSFEPDPINFSNLKKNIEVNGYKNVFVLNKAVFDRSGTAHFSSHSRYPLDRGNLHLLTEYEKANQKHKTVDTISLDTFFSDKPKKVDIIKMDIEGSEFEALKGMSELISTNKKLKLFFEFNPYVLTRHGTDLDTFIDYLFDIYTQIYHLDVANKTKRHINKNWLLDFAKEWKASEKKGHFINLLGIRDMTGS